MHRLIRDSSIDLDSESDIRGGNKEDGQERVRQSLSLRWRKAPSEKQMDMLALYGAGHGWDWVAATIARCPKGSDPIAFVKAQHLQASSSAKRQKQATERDAKDRALRSLGDLSPEQSAMLKAVTSQRRWEEVERQVTECPPDTDPIEFLNWYYVKGFRDSLKGLGGTGSV